LTWRMAVLELESVGRGGRPEGEWIASRVREAMSCFDKMKTRRQETEVSSQNERNAGNETPAPATGFYRICNGFYRIRVDSYRIITGFYRLWIGFYRLLPDKIFWRPSGAWNQYGEGMKPQTQRHREKRSLEPGWGSSESGFWRKNYAFFHDFPRFYAQNRAVFTRFYAFLRVGPIF